MWLLLLFASLQDDSEVRDGKTYASKSHGVTFSIPSKEWGAIKIGGDIPPKRRWPGILATFMDGSENVGGALTAEASKLKILDYADHFEKSLRKDAGSKKFEKTKGEEPHAGFEGAIRRWYEWEYEKDGKKYTFTYVTVFHSRDKFKYKLALWVEKKQWDAHKDAVTAILDSFKPLDGGGEKEIVLPNPWKGCGKGSSAKYKMGEVEIKYTLVDQDADSYTMSTNDGPPQKIQLKVKVKNGGEAPKVEEGEETIKVPKGEFKCKWVKTTTAQGWTKVWSSDDVPNRTVKLESEFGGTKSSMELVDFEKK